MTSSRNLRRTALAAALAAVAPLASAAGFALSSPTVKSGGTLTPRALSDDQLSKLGRTPTDDGIRRPSWLTVEEFERLRREAGE